ncbi:MAG TPA: nucleotidyltransferase domain-containing protein, partial [Kiritimatiellia bacterium]|nr:nucleotidyltransferase domain-containing protein [Kiritimatiellia bacterium]
IRHSNSVQRPLDPVAGRIVEKIAAEVCPEKLYLFGSRAAGTADPESDVDVLLVHSGRESPREVQLKTHRLFPRPEVALDVFVMTPEEFESQKRVANTLAREVSETGILCLPLFSKVGRPHRGRRAAAGRAR